MNDTPIRPGKKMRPKTRYSSPEQVAQKVDAAQAKINKYSAEAFEAEQKYKHLIQHGARADAEIQKNLAEERYRQIAYQQEVRLRKLRDISGKLATELLPWDGNVDRSVAV